MRRKRALVQYELCDTKEAFTPSDECFAKVATARDAFHRLTVESHYRSCMSGTGRDRRE